MDSTQNEREQNVPQPTDSAFFEIHVTLHAMLSTADLLAEIADDMALDS